MRKLKKSIVMPLCLILCVIMTISAAAADSMLNNGNFSEVSSDGTPEGWFVDSYLSNGYSVQAEDGEVTLVNLGGNDLRLYQDIAVEPNTVYEFTACISAENVTGGRGATLSIDNYSIDGSCLYSDSVSGTVDAQPVSLVFRTGEDQYTIRAALRLGGYSEDSKGTARFSDVSLTLGDSNALNIQALSAWGSQNESSNATSSDDSAAHTIFLKSVPHLFIALSVLLASVLVFGFYRNRKELASVRLTSSGKWKFFVVLAACGLILRSILCSLWQGHDSDMSCWIGWGSYIAENGTSTFYTAAGHEWYDYPPAYMLILGLIAKLQNLFGISSATDFGRFSYMLPAYTADILCAVLLMKEAENERFTQSAELLLGGLLLFSPAIVMLSGAWGQIDSILTLFLLLSFREFLHGRRISAGALYGLAIMFKWQGLIYGPVLALAYLLTCRKAKDIVETVLSVFAALAVVFIVSLPFKGTQSALWIIDRALSASGGYNYASVEAYNFFALIGGNWASADNVLFAGITYKTLGTIMILVFILFTAFIQGRRAWMDLRDPAHTRSNSGLLYLAACILMFGIFTFGHYMHERYIFPVIILLMFAYIHYKEPRLLLCSFFLSCTTFLNEATAMYVVSNLAMDTVRGGREHNNAVTVCALVEVILFLYFMYVACKTEIGNSSDLHKSEPERMTTGETDTLK